MGQNMKFAYLPTVICIEKQDQTLDPNSLDYQNRPESGRYMGQFWGKIARILVHGLLVVIGISTKITVPGTSKRTWYFKIPQIISTTANTAVDEVWFLESCFKVLNLVRTRTK